jgi:hypothetical protein
MTNNYGTRASTRLFRNKSLSLVKSDIPAAACGDRLLK